MCNGRRHVPLYVYEHSHTEALYGQLADKPTRRQLNWPKNQLAEIEIVTKIDVRFFGHMDVSFW